METEPLLSPSPSEPQQYPPPHRLELPPSLSAPSPSERLHLEALLTRKIDLRLLPTLILMYILNHLDRTSIASARLAGLEAPYSSGGLALTSTQYLTCLSIFFVGYLLMQVPSNLFLASFGRPSLHLPGCMLVWGCLSAATGATRGFAGLVAVRFVLGVVEAAFFPGAVFALSCWYRKGELGLRIAVLFSGSMMSGAFGGLISAGITNSLDGAIGLRAWRWLFIIEGAITVAVAIAAFFILPDFPRTTKWMTRQERALAIWRLEDDVGEDDCSDGKEESLLHGFDLAVKDIKMWILMTLTFSIVAAGSVTNIFPSLVSTLGYPPIPTLLLTVPPYALAVLTTFLNAWHADRTSERYLHVTLPLYGAVTAFVVAAATTDRVARYVAMVFMPAGVWTPYVVVLAWISNTLPRPPAKRAASLALINAVSNSSAIYASYLYPLSASPRYAIAMTVNCAAAVCAVGAATVLRRVLVGLNERAGVEGGRRFTYVV